VVAINYPRSPSQKAGIWLRIRYRFIPGHLIGEMLSKPWIDSSVPVIFLFLALFAFYFLTPDFFTLYGMENFGRLLGEYAMLAIGQAVVVIGGGIDLSIGAVFDLCNFIALALIFKFKVNVILVLPMTVLVGAALGSMNGLLIGYLRLRAFLTTLVTLILIRSIASWLGVAYGYGLVGDFDVNGMNAFNFISNGTVLGIPSSLVVALCLAVVAHILLTRSRLGWHIFAVGGSRRAAFNARIAVRRTVFLTYVISGLMVGLAAYFYAIRLNSSATSTGLGLELNVILGTVLGGISLGGGRGSATKALLGATVVLCITNGMLRLDLGEGENSIILGTFLLVAVVFDIYWSENRAKILDHAYVSPTLVELPRWPDIELDAVMQQGRLSEKLRAIGQGVLHGPGDVVLDGHGDLITGTAKGDILRFFGPKFEQHEVLARTGGRPLGMQIDRDGSIVICVAGIGLYRVTQNGSATALAVQTKRSFSLIDNSRFRMANGVDVASDGKIFFSDSTIRYDVGEWMTDALEGRRSGRVLCYDPSTQTTSTVASRLVFANGVCLAADGQSVLVSETWAARIVRCWIAGPMKGKVELAIPNLPGYPGNIKRSSDGGYWVALLGIRSPAFEIAQRMPGFRRRMIARLGADNWLFPTTNVGCVIKLGSNGQIVEFLLDGPESVYPQIASAREHNGKLYLSGINNDRIGVIDLPNSDQSWTDSNSKWGRG
jgi:ribose transport system permease protein